jgi:hypothetical protein
MRILRILGVMLMCVVLVGVYLFPDQQTLANGQASKPTEGVESNHPNYGEGNTGDQGSSRFGPTSTKYFKVGKSFILSSGDIVTVSGSTEAYIAVDTIGIELYLQRWDAASGKWIDVAYAGEWKNYNSSFVMGGVDIRVVRGYYYRTRAVHWVVESGTTEQKYSATSYIYVP